MDLKRFKRVIESKWAESRLFRYVFIAVFLAIALAATVALSVFIIGLMLRSHFVSAVLSLALINIAYMMRGEKSFRKLILLVTANLVLILGAIISILSGVDYVRKAWYFCGSLTYSTARFWLYRSKRGVKS